MNTIDITRYIDVSQQKLFYAWVHRLNKALTHLSLSEITVNLGRTRVLQEWVIPGGGSFWLEPEVDAQRGQMHPTGKLLEQVQVRVFYPLDGAWKGIPSHLQYKIKSAFEDFKISRKYSETSPHRDRHAQGSSQRFTSVLESLGRPIPEQKPNPPNPVQSIKSITLKVFLAHLNYHCRHAGQPLKLLISSAALFGFEPTQKAVSEHLRVHPISIDFKIADDILKWFEGVMDYKNLAHKKFIQLYQDNMVVLEFGKDDETSSSKLAAGMLISYYKKKLKI